MEKKPITIDYFIDKEIILFLRDGDKIQRKDGILKGWDDYNYYIIPIVGIKTGGIHAIPKTSIIRIEFNKGDSS